MPEVTGFEKRDAGSKRGINNMSDPSLLSSEKADLLEIPLFNSEKVDQNNEEQPQNVSAQEKFNEYLIQAVDEALISLGEPVKNTVYFQLENNFNIPKNEIPAQIDEFTNIMHKIFGLGASRLEIKFMKNLYAKIKVNVEANGSEWALSKWIIDDMSFTEYVQKTREEYCNCNKNNKLSQKTEVPGN